MRQLVEMLKDEADVILFDSPPNLVVTDASVLAVQVDGVLLVAEAGRTRRTTAQQAAEQLKQLGINIVGVVLNGVRVPHSNNYYYYQYHHTQEKQE
jgi:Mrp family chromosome partitioning ATPase